jgi:hypothetical protein
MRDSNYAPTSQPDASLQVEAGPDLTRISTNELGGGREAREELDDKRLENA